MKWVQRLFAAIAIEVRDGKGTLLKGKIRAAGASEVASICRGAGVPNGEVWVSKMGKITISPEIPEALHQQIRNAVVAAMD